MRVNPFVGRVAGAVLSLMEDPEAAPRSRSPVCASDRTGSVWPARQPVYAEVIAVGARSAWPRGRMVGPAPDIWQHAEIVIERVILLHQHKDMADVSETGRGIGGMDTRHHHQGQHNYRQTSPPYSCRQPRSRAFLGTSVKTQGSSRSVRFASCHRASIAVGPSDLRSRPRSAASRSTTEKRAMNLSHARRNVSSAL
jgi:hypothetical protein